MSVVPFFKPRLTFVLVLSFVLIVSLVLVYLDLERRESASDAEMSSNVNHVYSNAYSTLNEFYWQSVDTTIGLTFQGVQKKIFESFSESTESRDNIGRIFRHSFALNKSVSQIRWIDRTGFERYRMNRILDLKGQEDILVVPNEELQDKSERYYFTETKKLNSGYIYLSNLDLNIENGSIVTPYQPTIRLATPVKNDKNEFQGIIIVNFNLSDVFNVIGTLKAPGISIDLFNVEGSLRYSSNMPNASFLDILHKDLLKADLQAVQAFYNKAETFKKVTSSPETLPYHAFGHLEYAPQVRAQDYTSLFVSAMPSYMDKEFKNNLVGSLFLGSAFLFIGLVLSFLLYRADRKVSELNAALSQQLRVSEHSRDIKSQFLANMSHEIRTPMTAISGLLELLLKEKLDERVYKRLRIIKESSDGLRRIINDILDLSKIESGKSVLSEVEFRPSLTIERCISTFNGSFTLQNSELLLDMDPNLFFYYCRGDEYRIEQVINNLLSNAIKFSNNKPVTILVKSKLNDDDSLSMTCSVIDNGIGMSESLVKQLGESFTQADNSVSKENEGTGLGLSISKALLRSMGAELEISSELGKGSTFSFILNLQITKKENNVPIQSLKIDDLHVWLLNKDNKNSVLINKLFKHWGCNATTITSKAELVSVIQDLLDNNRTLDFIIFDLENAISDDDIQYILEHFTEDRIQNTKLVLMTSDEDKLMNYSNANVQVDLLKKPVTISGFLELLQRLKLVPSIQAIEDDEDVLIKSLEANIIDRVEQSGQPRILLVEDNLTNQMIISEIFKSMKIEVILANNGQEAVTLVASHSFDMIFMDIQMPVMDGLAATEIIRKQFSSTELPIIALSAGVTEQEFSKSSQVGMNTHVPKPIDLNKLMNVVLEFWPAESVAVIESTPEPEPEPEPEELSEATSTPSITLEELQLSERFDLSNTVYKWLGEAAYLQIVHSFLAEYSEMSIEEGRLSQEEKSALVHNLKSASGNIGAVVLFKACELAEEQLFTNDISIQHLLNALNKDMQTVQQAIH
ncbi:MAG: ATP-binding protein [Marinomonas sp.]